MCINVLSYQAKTQKGVIFMQALASVLFFVNYLIIGAYTGAVLNLVAILRGVVYGFRERFHAEKGIWLAVFCVIYALTYVMTFTVFSKPFTLENALIELLPVIAVTAGTVAFKMGTARHVRLSVFVNSPSWLVYNFINFVIGGIICESIAIVSAIIGIIRHDLKRKPRSIDQEKSA